MRIALEESIACTYIKSKWWIFFSCFGATMDHLCELAFKYIIPSLLLLLLGLVREEKTVVEVLVHRGESILDN